MTGSTKFKQEKAGYGLWDNEIYIVSAVGLLPGRYYLRERESEIGREKERECRRERERERE